MAYAIRYRKRVKSVLDSACATYGSSLAGPLHKWLSRLSEEAEGRNHKISLDAMALLETMITDHSDLKKWTRAGRLWLSAPMIAKVKAIGVVLTKRCPPWEFRAAVKTFQFLGQCTYEVTAFYEIDHVGKRIIFTMLDVPGPAES